MKIRKTVEQQFDELIRVRRDLHKIPGYSFDVSETRDYLTDYLRELEPDILQPCGEGIKAVFRAENAQKTVAIRADMDGLRIREETGCAFASKN